MGSWVPDSVADNQMDRPWWEGIRVPVVQSQAVVAKEQIRVEEKAEGRADRQVGVDKKAEEADKVELKRDKSKEIKLARVS